MSGAGGIWYIHSNIYLIISFLLDPNLQSQSSIPGSPSPSQSSTDARPTSRDLEEAAIVHPQSNGVVSRNPTAPPSMESRKRSSAMSEMSPKVRNRTSAESGSGKRSVKEDGSPLMSPRDGSPVGRRSRSPGRK